MISGGSGLCHDECHLCRTPMGRFGRTLFLGGAFGLATLTPWPTPWPVVQCEGVVTPVSESAQVKDMAGGIWDVVVLVVGKWCFCFGSWL